MPDSRQIAATAPSRASSLMQVAVPAALVAISVAVAFLMQRVDELSKELMLLDQGRLTIARATAEVLASQSRTPGSRPSRGKTRAPLEHHDSGRYGESEEEQGGEEDEEDPQDGDEQEAERIVEVTENSAGQSGRSADGAKKEQNLRASAR